MEKFINFTKEKTEETLNYSNEHYDKDGVRSEKIRKALFDDDMDENKRKSILLQDMDRMIRFGIKPNHICNMDTSLKDIKYYHLIYEIEYDKLVKKKLEDNLAINAMKSLFFII